MNCGATHSEVRKQPKYSSTSGQGRSLHCHAICSLVKIGFGKRSTNLFIALFGVVALLRSVTIKNNHTLLDSSIDSAESNLRERLPSFGPKGWSDVNLLIYMTTHLPDAHTAYLPCWKDAIERLDIFKYADLMLYTSAIPTDEQLEQLQFRHVVIKNVTNPGKQSGAVQAMIDPFLENVTWFDNYDWVIRLNLDVLIRDDAWLMQTMLNTSVDMIVQECYSENKYTNKPMLHSDFFAFRPTGVDRERLLIKANRRHAETHFTQSFRHLYDTGRFAYVEGGSTAIYGQCRIAGPHSPVLHVHDFSRFCPYYYNVSHGRYA